MNEPEGLKRLRQAGYPWLNSAADLMMEMAEILEGLSGKDGYEKANDVLKKFKEWK